MTGTYTPVACAAYDVFEIAIMRGERLRICWVDDGGALQEALITPLDLTTRDRAEWLIARVQQGGVLSLRLDQIKSADTSKNSFIGLSSDQQRFPR